MPTRITTRRQDAIDRFNAMTSGVVSQMVDGERTKFADCCRDLFIDTHMTTKSIEQVTEIIRMIIST